MSMRLRNVDSLLPYHSHVDPGTVVSALNHMIDDVNNGKTVVGNPERPLLSYPQVVAFRMSVPFMRAFPMP